MKLNIPFLAFGLCALCVLCGSLLLTGCASGPSSDVDTPTPTISFTPQDAEMAGSTAAFLFLREHPERLAKLERIATDIETALTERSELTRDLLSLWAQRLVSDGQLTAEDAAFLVPLLERIWARFQPDLAPLPTLDPAVRDNVRGLVAGMRDYIATVKRLSVGN